jgi:formylglycine-generating enzyme required for sulfatase activity
MVFVRECASRMGSDRHYPEEAPVHQVRVSSFWIDETPVTKSDFRQFVDATGYLTVAEISPDPGDYPGAAPDMLKPGSRQYWTNEPGAVYGYGLGNYIAGPYGIFYGPDPIDHFSRR